VGKNYWLNLNRHQDWKEILNTWAFTEKRVIGIYSPGPNFKEGKLRLRG